MKPIIPARPLAAQAIRFVLYLAISLGLMVGCSDDSTGPTPNQTVDVIDEYPAWSPVDSMIAFHRSVPSSYGPPGVYLIAPSGDSARLLYRDDPLPVVDLRFSPDGSTLAGVRDGQLITLDVANGTLRQLSYTNNGAAEPDWSPDGAALVYRRIFLDNGEPSDSAGLHVLNVASSSDNAVLPGTTEVFGTHPRWSPTDSLIVFAAGNLRTIHPDGSALRSITTPPSARDDRSPTWTPDGSALFYLQTGGTGPAVTRFVLPNGSGDRLWHSSYGGMFCLSGDGKQVVFAGTVAISNSRSALVLFVQDVSDATGATRHQLTAYLQ